MATRQGDEICAEEREVVIDMGEDDKVEHLQLGSTLDVCGADLTKLWGLKGVRGGANERGAFAFADRGLFLNETGGDWVG